MKHEEPNELYRELLSVSAFNPFYANTSSSRAQMTSSHLSQSLVINGATQRLIQTGVEREFGKYTFNVKMPCNGVILEIIERYSATLGLDAIKENPQTVVIYEDEETKQLGIITLANYCSNHQYFGFQYQAMGGLQQLRVGAFIPKDTVFLDSPNIDEDGGYKLGIQANIALMTHPAVSEDGILISRDMLPKLAFKTYENRVVEWGNKQFALNLYGDNDTYKPFPDIGDYLRSDGVLMALRDFEPNLLSPVEQSIHDCRDIDFTFDTTVYANGPSGRVVDIKIHHDLCNSNFADVNMDHQPQKYDAARRIFYGRIVDFWKKMEKKRGGALQLTPEFHRLIVESLSVATEQNNQKITKLYRQAPLDDYRVEFVIEYNMIPNIGNKLTGLHGTRDT